MKLHCIEEQSERFTQSIKERQRSYKEFWNMKRHTSFEHNWIESLRRNFNVIFISSEKTRKTKKVLASQWDVRGIAVKKHPDLSNIINGYLSEWKARELLTTITFITLNWHGNDKIFLNLEEEGFGNITSFFLFLQFWQVQHDAHSELATLNVSFKWPSTWRDGD